MPWRTSRRSTRAAPRSACWATASASSIPPPTARCTSGCVGDGLLLTEFPPGRAAHAGSFPAPQPPHQRAGAGHGRGRGRRRIGRAHHGGRGADAGPRGDGGARAITSATSVGTNRLHPRRRHAVPRAGGPARRTFPRCAASPAPRGERPRRPTIALRPLPLTLLERRVCRDCSEPQPLHLDALDRAWSGGPAGELLGAALRSELDGIVACRSRAGGSCGA